MAATRDSRTAKRKLSALGISSATVLTGSTTITIDLAAFDQLCARARHFKALPIQRGETLPDGASGVQHMCDPYGCAQHPR